MNTKKGTDSDSRSKPRSNVLLIGIGILALIILTLTTISGMALALSTQDTVVKGITIEGESVSGLTHDELKDFVQKKADEYIAKSALNISYQEKNWCIKPDEIKLSIDVNKATEEAYAPGHTDSLLQNLTENLQSTFYGKNITFNVSYDPNLLDKYLKQIADDVYREPVNASCYFGNNGNIIHSKSVLGQKLNTEELTAFIEEKLNPLNVPSVITIEPVITKPYVTDDDVKNINNVLSTYTTRFYEGDSARSQNIRIASNSISGQIIKPNQVFSFNDTVGHRTSANGFQTASVIIDGKVEQDWGGGVCQVSSTLYNAVLLAGLTPTERSNHSLPSSYVPLGQDATVADGLLDFKFKNPLPHSVYILTSCYSGTLNIFVLGCQEDLQGKSYKLSSKVNNNTATVYRVVYKNGEEIDREYLHADSYDPPHSTT